MEPNENNVTPEVNEQSTNTTPQNNNNQPVEQQEPEKQAPVEKQDNQPEQQEEEKKPKRTKDLKKFPVDSSNLDWIAYDKDKEDLYIQFRSGGLYVYHDVPYNIFDGLLTAGSKGRYHNMKIKWKYKYEKLKG